MRIRPVEQVGGRDCRRGRDPFAEIVGCQQLERRTGPHDESLAVVVAQVDSPIAAHPGSRPQAATREPPAADLPGLATCNGRCGLGRRTGPPRPGQQAAGARHFSRRGGCLGAIGRGPITFASFTALGRLLFHLLTRLPQGVECQWRCVLAGSPEGNAAAGLRGEMVLDLTQPLGLAPNGPLVQAARTGKVPQEAAAPPTDGTSMLVIDDDPEITTTHAARSHLGDDSELRPAPPPLLPGRASPGTSRYPKIIDFASNAKKQRVSRTVVLLSIAVVALLGTTIGLSLFITQHLLIAQHASDLKQKGDASQETSSAAPAQPDDGKPPITMSPNATNEKNTNETVPAVKGQSESQHIPEPVMDTDTRQSDAIVGKSDKEAAKNNFRIS